MALTPEQISLMAFNDDPGDWNDLAFRDCWVKGYEMGARAIEAEVRKDDEALIRKMLEALTAPVEGDELHALHMAAIAAARSRLEKAP